MDDPWSQAPRLTLHEASSDPLPSLLRAISRLLVQHPVAVQAAFSALVAEGRRFAQTPDGQRWRAALANSELVRRGRALWEGSALNLLEDTPETVIPSAVLDAFVLALSRPDLHTRIPQLLHNESAHGDDS